MNQFDLNNFEKNPDGTFSKKKTQLQPREMKVTPKSILKEEYNKTLLSKTHFFKGKSIQDVFEDAKQNNYIFIPKNVPSLKNSKQLRKNSKTGKNFITSSDLCKEYVKQAEFHFTAFRSQFLEMVKGKELPYRIQFFFIRDKHKSFDYGNITQIILDCMTANAFYPRTKDKITNEERKLQRKKYAWIEDDDADHVIPNYDKGYAYDPIMPGVIIKIL